jgi:hypothetical protein
LDRGISKPSPAKPIGVSTTFSFVKSHIQGAIEFLSISEEIDQYPSASVFTTTTCLVHTPLSQTQLCPSPENKEKMAVSGKTFIVEHLDPELGPWSELEYLAIARETQATHGSFILSSLPSTFQVPTDLASNPAFTAEQRGVEELYAANKSRVCLLDPSAAKDLSPEDGENFDAFLFGGILGT